ncbi:MAG: MoxR family ATPase [Candidatus Aminicenantes bacterium]|nr:MAG: MoxR family ATPase [Candidatus Aminicenantes bacterium]
MDKILSQVGQIILGKDKEIRMVFTCLLAKGHLLIEDIPGVGKTTLAQALAKSLELSYNRIQFTSDILPADIIGTSILDKETQEFRFHEGPLFDQMVLADELNRATPRTQSALLEAMEERQVSVDGVTYELPTPFFVIATQNQRYHVGTFPLPESQMDRFLMRISLGYPDYQSERKLLLGENRFDMLKKLTPVISSKTLLEMQDQVPNVHVSEAILDYVQGIIAGSRSGSHHYLGLSPRAGISLVKAAQAWAVTEGRDMVLPEDIQAVSGNVLEHRLDPEGSKIKHKGTPAAEQLIKTVSLHL